MVPPVIGMEDGAGTDKLAGREARFFVGAVELYPVANRRRSPEMHANMSLPSETNCAGNGRGRAK